MLKKILWSIFLYFFLFSNIECFYAEPISVYVYGTLSVVRQIKRAMKAFGGSGTNRK